MPIRALLLILAMLFLLGPLQAAESTADRLRPPTGRIEMVLDSDMFNEVDDQFALAFAARSPERIDLKAVYAAPFLNHRSKSAGDGMEKSCHETLRVLTLMGEKTDGRVFRGSDRFLTDRNTPVDSPAARHLIRLAHQDRKGPLYVVGLGAATNLASALLLDPSIADRMAESDLGHRHHRLAIGTGRDGHQSNRAQSRADGRGYVESWRRASSRPGRGQVGPRPYFRSSVSAVEQVSLPPSLASSNGLPSQ